MAIEEKSYLEEIGVQRLKMLVDVSSIDELGRNENARSEFVVAGE